MYGIAARFGISVPIMAVALAVAPPVGLTDEPATHGGFGSAEVVPPDELRAMRGRDGDVNITLASNQVVAVTSSGNSVAAENANAGSVSIADSAFQHMHGVNNLVNVTGHNSTGIGVVSVNIFLQ